MIMENKDIGAEFLRKTAYYEEGERTGHRVTHPKPEQMDLIPLPKPQPPLSSLHDVLATRRSRRQFSGEPITSTELSWLLWSVLGITGKRNDHLFYTNPSAGALYPLDTILQINEVDGIKAGSYLVQKESFCLQPIRFDDLGAELAMACLAQRFMEDAAINIAWAAKPEAATPRYKERAYRYFFLDAGHMAQSLHLACEAIGLSCCGIGAFNDSAVNEVLGIPPEHPVIYLYSIGRPAR